MPVELIGLIATQEASETHASDGPLVDRDYVRRFARAHEESDFDRVLIGYSSASPDNLQVAAYAAAHTDKLQYLVAHRPGVVQPTVAARYFATLDQFSHGRIALHTITGGFDAEQRRDGDYLEKADRYARTREYLQILKRAWTEDEPFSHEGRFYRFEDYVAHVKPFQQPRIPLYFGGSSEEAYAVGAAEADVYALFAQPLADIAEEIERIKAAAHTAGRDEPPRISVSFRPILGSTEDEAWERAHRILADAKERGGVGGAPNQGWRGFGNGPATAGSQRRSPPRARSTARGRGARRARRRRAGAASPRSRGRSRSRASPDGVPRPPRHAPWRRRGCGARAPTPHPRWTRESGGRRR